MNSVSFRKKLREMGADDLDKYLRKISLKENRDKTDQDHEGLFIALKQYQEVTGKNWKLLKS